MRNAMRWSYYGIMKFKTMPCSGFRKNWAQVCPSRSRLCIFTRSDGDGDVMLKQIKSLRSWIDLSAHLRQGKATPFFFFLVLSLFAESGFGNVEHVVIDLVNVPFTFTFELQKYYFKLQWPFLSLNHRCRRHSRSDTFSRVLHKIIKPIPRF